MKRFDNLKSGERRAVFNALALALNIRDSREIPVARARHISITEAVQLDLMAEIIRDYPELLL